MIPRNFAPLDGALVDTVERAEELLVRAQGLSHATEEQVHRLTSAAPARTRPECARVDEAGKQEARRDPENPGHHDGD